MVNRKLIIISILSVALIAAVTCLILVFLYYKKDSNTGVVITSTVECTDAAKGILQKGGSAVDSAVAACLCIGVTSPHQSGLGGGMIATIYIKETGKFETLNSREVAPLAATKDMFKNNIESREGGKAVAVPG
jgi:gamma-glutamyltranspeptidase / glutathione hydrolase / leukotriene-C4 hydrolase